MIIKRVLSILFDFFSSFLPAIAVNYAGGNLVFSFLFFFIITQIGELFLLKGRTAGMAIFKIYPKESDNKCPKQVKLIFYHIVLSILIFNMLNPSYNIILECIIPILLFVPFHESNRYNAAIDLLFRIHWSYDCA